VPEESFDPTVTAFILVKTTPEWLGLSVEQRVKDVRSRFFDTEFYSAWEARDHEAYQLLIEALRETPF
jgi:hypothetical protein